MSLLPGMKIVGRSTLSEIVQDQTFSESMKQLNHDSDRYQWDILGFKFQRVEPTTIQTNWGDYDISITSQPYWALEMDGDLQEISQEFNINFQEGTVKVPQSPTEMPILLQGFRKHSLFTHFHDENIGNTDRYNTTEYITNIGLKNPQTSQKIVDQGTLISTGMMDLRDQNYYTSLTNYAIQFDSPKRVDSLRIPPVDIQILSIEELDPSGVIFSDSNGTRYSLSQTFLIAGGFSTVWSNLTVFQVKGLQNSYYELIGIELPDSTTISNKIITIPKTVQSIKVQENGSILLTDSKLNVSYCSYLSTIASIDGNSSRSRIGLTTNQISQFSSRITTVGDKRLFDGVLEVEEEENR